MLVLDPSLTILQRPIPILTPQYCSRTKINGRRMQERQGQMQFGGCGDAAIDTGSHTSVAHNWALTRCQMKSNANHLPSFVPSFLRSFLPCLLNVALATNSGCCVASTSRSWGRESLWQLLRRPLHLAIELPCEWSRPRQNAQGL